MNKQELERLVQTSAAERADLQEQLDAAKRTIAGQQSTQDGALKPLALLDTHVIVVGYGDFLSGPAITAAKSYLDNGEHVQVIGFGCEKSMLGDVRQREGMQYAELKKYAAQATCTAQFDFYNGTMGILGLTGGLAVPDTDASAGAHQQAHWLNECSILCDALATVIAKYRNVLSVTQGGVKLAGGHVNGNKIDYFTALLQEQVVTDEPVANDEVPF